MPSYGSSFDFPTSSPMVFPDHVPLSCVAFCCYLDWFVVWTLIPRVVIPSLEIQINSSTLPFL